MIHANELRIGNWVSFKGMWNGEVEKFTSSSITIKDNSGFFDIDSFDGIEIDDNILIKIGFRFIKLGITASWEGYSLLDRFNIEKKDGQFIWDRFVVLKNLHQLQNLYFALTGQELSVNLDTGEKH